MTGRHGFRLRRSTIKDIEVLVQQRRGMWMDMGVRDAGELARADVEYRRWAGRRLRDGSLTGWIVKGPDGMVVGGGCVWVQPVQPRPGRRKMVQPYLLSMYTVPGFRGKGVASRIVREAARWTGRKGFDSLRLHASEMGRPVYRRLGFKRTWEMRLNMPKARDRVSRTRKARRA